MDEEAGEEGAIRAKKQTQQTFAALLGPGGWAASLTRSGNVCLSFWIKTM